jgi:small subunit ribosomal protein S16
VAVKIRLMRVGKKKQPTYRVVVADSRSPRDGRFIEILGQYEPRHDPSRISLDTDRALHWLQLGAQPTEQVAKILDVVGVWDAYKSANGKEAAAKPAPKTPKPKAEKPTAEKPAAEKPVAEAPASESDSEPDATAPDAGADAEPETEAVTEAETEAE